MPTTFKKSTITKISTADQTKNRPDANIPPSKRRTRPKKKTVATALVRKRRTKNQRPTLSKETDSTYQNFPQSIPNDSGHKLFIMGDTLAKVEKINLNNLLVILTITQPFFVDIHTLF